MSIYRRKLSSGKRSGLYTAEFSHRGRKHIRSGFPDRDSAKLWLNTEQLKLRRGAVGYVKPMLAAQVTPLVDAYVAHLKGKGRDAAYCYVAGQRLRKLAGECGWLTLGHVTRESLQSWLATGTEWKGRDCGPKTLNQYADLAVEWGKWLASVAVGKLPTNPLAGAERLQEKVNETYRRAATVEELNKLLATCSAERRVYYLTRLYTPMRGRTYGRLTWRMAHLDASPPFFATPAESNKSRRPEKHVLRYDVAQELRALRKRTKAKADSLVFPVPPTLDDLRADLAAAGVAFELGKNHRRLDFHAFRRTAIRLAKSAGVSLDQASLLLGHKSSATTKKYYDEDAVDPDLGRTVEALPTLGQVRKAE